MKKIYRIVVPFLLGILFLWCGISSFLYNHSIVTHGEKVNGEIIDVESYISHSRRGGDTRMYKPVIKYTCWSQELTGTSSTSSSVSPKIGDSISLYCMGNKMVVDDFMSIYGGLMFAGFGGIADVVILIWIFTLIKKARMIEYLKKNGDRIEANVVFVWENTSFRTNGRSPFRIEAQYSDLLNNLWQFKSENIWFDITNLVHVGDKIWVLVDRNNYKKYWVDTSFLPKIK